MTTSPLPELWVCHLGVVPYGEALALQELLRARRQAGELPDTLLLLEHPPVYTRGRRAGAEDLPFAESFYRERGIEIADTDRGGRITYHGPGQLVGYPIVAVGDVGRYVRSLEAAIVGALAAEGLPAHARPADGPDYTGVWVGTATGGAPGRAYPGGHRQAGEQGTADVRKIASIGVHVQRGVATHGFAVNVVNALEPFEWIVACGIAGVRMTSLIAERPLAGAREGMPARVPAGADGGLPSRAHPGGRRQASAAGPERGPADAAACAMRLRCFRRRMADSFCRTHARRQRLITPQRLERELRDPSWRAARRAPLEPPSRPEPAFARQGVPA